VAVVEDDVSCRESLEGLLQATGYAVLPYVSAEDFLASGRLQEIHCLVTDYGLPGLNGIDLLLAAHSLRSELPVILVTGNSETDILRRALSAGAHCALSKPVDTAALLSAISGVC
jgi:FixJ family two-component response regulator